MRTENANRVNATPLALKNKSGEVTGWIAKMPGPRRSMFSEVRQAVRRLIEQVRAEPSRLRNENHALTQANEKLRTMLGHDDPTAVPNALNPQGSGGASAMPWIPTRREEYDRLAEENKLLQGNNFVLRQMVVTDAQLNKVFEALTNPGSGRKDIRNEADKFFDALSGLNGQRSDHVRTIAGLYTDRLQIHLNALKNEPGQLQALEDVAGKYLRVGSDTKTDGLVLETILFGAQAKRLGIETVNIKFGQHTDIELESITKHVNELLMSVQQHAPDLTPEDTVPGTPFTVDALANLFKDAATALDRRITTRARDLILNHAAAPQKTIASLTPKQRATVEQAMDLFDKRPEIVSPKMKAALDGLRKRLNPQPTTKAVVAKPLTPRQPAKDVATAKSDFQQTLRQAMNLMWNVVPMTAEEVADFNKAASIRFVKAIDLLQVAVPTFRLKDEDQIKWIRETVQLMKPDMLTGLHNRLEAGFFDHLEQAISNNGGMSDAIGLAGQWMGEIESRVDELNKPKA